MSKVKLNQIIAVEKGQKERAHKEVTALYQGLAKTDPMQGISRTYQPKDDEGEQLPPENKYVQIKVADQIDRLRKVVAELFDVTLTKERGNTLATADVKVGDTVIVANVPVTYLLFMEKELTDIRTFIQHLPKLDPAEKWSLNEQQGFFESEPIRTKSTKKVTEFVVVPGSGVPEKGVKPDVKEISNDIVAGYWSTIKFSATMEPSRVAELLERVDSLLKAVKFAREEANSTEVEQQRCGKAVMDWLFA